MDTEKESSIEVLDKIKAEIAAVDAKALDDVNATRSWYANNKDFLILSLTVGLIIVAVALAFAYPK